MGTGNHVCLRPLIEQHLNHPITFKLNLEAITLCVGENLPVPNKPSTCSKLQNPSYDLLLSLEAQKGIQLTLASEDPAIDAGL